MQTYNTPVHMGDVRLPTLYVSQSTSRIHTSSNHIHTTMSPAQDSVLADLLTRNAQWAKEFEEANPGLLQQLATADQEPKVLWIGCVDSRVPASVVTGSTIPGEMLVHRNIANQYFETDLNARSVLEFAIGALGISHIAVIGHTNCGGVNRAHALAHNPSTLEALSAVDEWLLPLTELANSVGPEVTRDDLVEVNVRAQVEALKNSKTLQAAGKRVWIHGLVYELRDGLLRDLGVTGDIPKVDAAVEK